MDLPPAVVMLVGEAPRNVSSGLVAAVRCASAREVRGARVPGQETSLIASLSPEGGWMQVQSGLTEQRPRRSWPVGMRRQLDQATVGVAKMMQRGRGGDHQPPPRMRASNSAGSI